MVETVKGTEITMWLIVGANGQLGRSVHNEFVVQGIEHMCTGRESLDITDQRSVDDFFRQHKLSTIINCAAWTAVDLAEDHEEEALEINSNGVARLAKAAVEHDARLIHMSTDYVFNGSSNNPYEVSTPTSPANAYGRTKLEGERQVMEIGNGSFPIVRTAWLYSRYGKNFAKTMASHALRDLPVKVVNDQFGQPTMAADVAKLITEIAKHPAPPAIVHGTNSGVATWFDFAQAIYKNLGVDVNRVSPVSTTEFPTKAVRPKYSVLSHSELNDTGIAELRPWLEALCDEIKPISDALKSEME